jgi:hypothetical protein
MNRTRDPSLRLKSAPSQDGAANKRTIELAERRELYEVILRNRFQRFSGFAPGGEAADDHERVESSFPQ